MKITQEQIEAAINYADNPFDIIAMNCLQRKAIGINAFATSAKILAAAYREKCDECDDLKKELRHIANLLDAHFDNGGTVAGLGTTNKARKLLNDKP